MYEVLKINLELDKERHRGLYWLIEDIFEIYLSLGDKSRLLEYLKQNDHPCFYDLQYDVATYLWNNGYKSNQLKLWMDEFNKSEKRYLECWTRKKERIDKKKLVENQ